MNLRIAALLGLALVAGGSIAQAEEKKIPLKEVPQKVLDTVKKRFPNGEMKSAEEEKEGGETTYEITLTNEGKKVTVSVEDDGELEEIETELSVDELPRAVIQAIGKKYPKAKIKSAELVVEIEDGKEEKKHEAEIELVGGKTIEVVVDAKGNVKEEEAEKK